MAARHLHNAGSNLRVLLTAPADTLGDVPRHQAAILHKMGLDLSPADTTAPDRIAADFAAADLIVDALIGYSLAGAPRGSAADLIEAANASGKSVVALDVPSGVDAGSGAVYEPSIRVAATMTLALPKTGLGAPAVRERLGDLYLADISVPPALYARLGLDVEPLFGGSGLVRLEPAAAGWALPD